MQDIKRYSWSLYSAYQACSKKVYFAKIWGIEQAYKDYFAHGSEVHEAVEQYHKGLEYNHDIISRYVEKVPKNLYEGVEEWINATIHNPDDKNDIIETEFCGRIDGRGKDFIADLKTMNGSISQRGADEMGQVTLYLYMEWINTGKLKPFKVINLRKDKNAKGELFPLQVIDTTRTIDDFRAMWVDLKAFDNSIKQDIYYKEPSYQCATCEYRRVCRAESN